MMKEESPQLEEEFVEAMRFVEALIKTVDRKVEALNKEIKTPAEEELQDICLTLKNAVFVLAVILQEKSPKPVALSCDVVDGILVQCREIKTE